MACERKPDIEKNCVKCGKPLERKRYPGGLLETYGRYVIRVRSTYATTRPEGAPESVGSHSQTPPAFYPAQVHFQSATNRQSKGAL